MSPRIREAGRAAPVTNAAVAVSPDEKPTTGTRLPSGESESPVQAGGSSPTEDTARVARARATADPVATQLRLELESRLPKGGTDPGDAGDASHALPSDGPISVATREAAKAALAEEGLVDANNPYAVIMGDARNKLERLGLLETNTEDANARIYVADSEWTHGAAIVRTLAGKTSLAKNAEVYLAAPPRPPPGESKPGVVFDFRDVPPGTKDPCLADWVDYRLTSGGQAGNIDLVTKELRRVREALPNDGKKTFVNFSFGWNPDQDANTIAQQMLRAERGTKAYAETQKALEPHFAKPGHENDAIYPFDKDQIAYLEKHVVRPAMVERAKSDTVKDAVQKSRASLHEELRACEKAGIVVFQSAGNDRANFGDSLPTKRAWPGLQTVASVKLPTSSFDDDKVARSSARGVIAAPGVKIPVGAPDADGRATNVSGTSFASPVAAQIGYAMNAVNPELGVRDLERLMQRREAVHDIAGTLRDGRGEIDPFAAVVLAKNPKLTTEDIENARSMLDGNPSNEDIRKLREQLRL